MINGINIQASRTQFATNLYNLILSNDLDLWAVLVLSDTQPFQVPLLIGCTRALELLFMMQSILCWAILIITYGCYFLKVAAWRSPHQSPPGYFCHSSTSVCNFSQHEKETSHTQPDWSFHCNGPGMIVLGRIVQQHIKMWLTQTAKSSATFRLCYLAFCLTQKWGCCHWCLFVCLMDSVTLFDFAVSSKMFSLE